MAGLDKRNSTLSGALRRIGGQLPEIQSVEGTFIADGMSNGRVFGVLKTHDAVVRVSFDRSKVKPPATSNCNLIVSGKVWLDEGSSTFVLMVNHYKLAGVRDTAHTPHLLNQGLAL